MPTNEERREVAARLRRLSGHREVDKEFVHEALGLYMGECVDGYDPVSVSKLADLMEPEERTCRIYDTDHEFEDSIRCDACQMTFRRPWQPFKFCPNCGAKVVSE